MKLIITINLESEDGLEESDFETLVEESRRDDCSGIRVMVGSHMEDSPCARVFELMAEHFEARVEREVEAGAEPKRVCEDLYEDVGH